MTGHDKESEKKLKARRDNATLFCTILVQIWLYRWQMFIFKAKDQIMVL